MPHTLGKIFTHAQLLDFKNRNSSAGSGVARLACSSINTCAASRDPSQQPALLQTAAKTTAGGSTGKEDLKADRQVRHYKEVGLQEWPLAVEPPSRVFYTVSVSACLFAGERIFQKVYGRPLPSTSPFTPFARQTERLTSAVLLGLVFRCQWGKHEGFVKYLLRLRSNGKEKLLIFVHFRQPPKTLHIHSTDRERTWPEAHCQVCDSRAFSTMVSLYSVYPT